MSEWIFYSCHWGRRLRLWGIMSLCSVLIASQTNRFWSHCAWAISNASQLLIWTLSVCPIWIGSFYISRSFSFRWYPSREDVGKYKCLVAKERLQQRFPDVSIDVHLCPLESLPPSFYQQFDLILSGLDTVEARLHLNSLLYSLLEYDDKNQLDPLSVHPFIDGGTEGLLGNYRLVIPGVWLSAPLWLLVHLLPAMHSKPVYEGKRECASVYDCDCSPSARTLHPLCPTDLFPKGLSRYCSQCTPYSVDVEFDAEKEEHVTYVLQRAQERADQFHIHGVTSFLVTVSYFLPLDV